VGISLAFQLLFLLQNAGELLTAVGFGPGQPVTTWVSSINRHSIIRAILVDGSAAPYLITLAILAYRWHRRSVVANAKAASV
jgi:hypothetical protein